MPLLLLWLKIIICVIFYTIFWFRQEWFDVWNIFFTFWKLEMKKKKIQTSNRTMSTSILFVCQYERYFHSLYFLCPPVCMKFWPISGCNPFTQVHWFCRTDCWLYDLRYLDLKSCCLRLAFFPWGPVVTFVTVIVVCRWEQPSSRLLICDATSSFESSVRTTCHAVAIPDTNVKLHHSTMGHLCVLHWQV